MMDRAHAVKHLAPFQGAVTLGTFSGGVARCAKPPATFYDPFGVMQRAHAPFRIARQWMRRSHAYRMEKRIRNAIKVSVATMNVLFGITSQRA